MSEQTPQEDTTRAEAAGLSSRDRLLALKDEGAVVADLKNLVGVEMGSAPFMAFSDFVDQRIAQEDYEDHRRDVARVRDRLRNGGGTTPDPLSMPPEQALFYAEEALALARQRFGGILETVRTRANGVSGYDPAVTEIMERARRLSEVLHPQGDVVPKNVTNKLQGVKLTLIKDSSSQ